MAEDKFEQAKGNIKETVGNATDNKELEKDGKGIFWDIVIILILIFILFIL